MLVVDDDSEIRDLLAHYLTREGFRVLTARSGEAIDRTLSENRIDLVVLDLMMPGEDGLSICRRLRANSAVPIIILTAKGEEIDRVVGLEMGADDYMPKPFNPRELVARIKAVLWRTRHSYQVHEDRSRDERLSFGDWHVDPARRTVVSREGAELPLSSGEFDLLLAFLNNPRRVLSRDQLLDLTQGRSMTPYDRSIDVQVGRLRRKIEAEPKKPTIIKTVRGIGYSFTLPVERT